MNASRRLKSKEKHSGQTLHVSKESFVIHFFSIVDAAYSIIYETRHARSKIDLSLGVGKLCEQIVETRANRRRTGVSVAFRRDFPGRFITTGNHVKTGCPTMAYAHLHSSLSWPHASSTYRIIVLFNILKNGWRGEVSHSGVHDERIARMMSWGMRKIL